MAKSYAEKLKDPRWQKKRLKILERDKWTCQLCSDKEDVLHVHHLKYTGKNPWDAPNKDLTTYCGACHGFIEYKNSNGKVLGIGKIKISKELVLLVCKYNDGISFFSCFVNNGSYGDYELNMSLFNPQLKQLKDLLNGS